MKNVIIPLLLRRDKMSDFIFNQLTFVRKMTLKAIEGIDESKAEVIPDGYLEWFGNGTRPSDWKAYTPSMNDLKSILLNQSSRIKETFENRIHEKAASPYTTSTGFTLETIGECLTFSLYHEAMHFDRIKAYKRLLNI
jgi:hypothetical protein